MQLQDIYAGVVRDPESDSARLAYAAACDARGDHERAEFIRIQLAHRDYLRAGNPLGGFSEFDREWSLLDACGAEWAGEIANRVSDFTFYGGFVERVELDGGQFLACADELYRSAPIRRLALRKVANVLEPLASSPELSRIVSLELRRQELGDSGVAILASSPHLRSLRYLDLVANNITVAGLDELAASNRLPALEYVNLSGNPASEAVREPYGEDQGALIWYGEGGTLFSVEGHRGRKRWLHYVWDHGRCFNAMEL